MISVLGDGNAALTTSNGVFYTVVLLLFPSLINTDGLLIICQSHYDALGSELL